VHRDDIRPPQLGHEPGEHRAVAVVDGPDPDLRLVHPAIMQRCDLATSVPGIPAPPARASSEEEFDAAFGRIKDRGITYYADPACRQPGQVYASKNGRRGTYFRDPDGHLMEILTPLAGEPGAG
jgi:catechol 2,3-dioxygenase-like lactoylglutathione lyase family enzyme